MPNLIASDERRPDTQRQPQSDLRSSADKSKPISPLGIHGPEMVRDSRC